MIRSHQIVAVAIGLAALGGCKKKESAAPPVTAPAPADAAAAAAVVIDAPAAAALPAGVPADLPPFGTVAGADAVKARELAHEALSVNFSGEGDPVAIAVSAIKADPGSPHARSALACVTGDDAFDLAQLTPLTTAAACVACIEVVRNLLGGECEWSDAVLALAGKVQPGPQRLAAEAIVSSLSSGDPAAAAPFFKAAKVEYVYDKKKKVPGPKLLAQLTDQVKKAEEDSGIGGIVVGDMILCEADCCEVPIDQMQHNHDFLTKICFAPGTDQVASIELISGD